MRTFLRSKLTLLFMTLGMLLAFAGVALADQINADGDIVTANNQTTVNLGDVDPGQKLGPGETIAPEVSFQLNCNTQQHANPGGTISLNYSASGSTIPAGGSLSATNASISVPSTWPTDTNGCGSTPNQNDAGNSQVTITAPKSPGAKSFVVTYDIVAPLDANNSTGIQGASTRSVTYNMNVLNKPPTISSIDGAGSVTEGDEEIYTINASDPNETTLSYSLSVVSGDATVVSGGNTSTPTVKFNSPGDVVLRATVNDGVNTPVTLERTIEVASANTAPVVSVTGVTNGNSYEFGSVPTIGCSVEDAEDTGESATPQFDNSGLTNGLGDVEVTCSYTDAGGLSDSDTVTYTIVDTGDPVITRVSDSPASANGQGGWYTSKVTTTFKAEDFDGNGNTGAGFAGKTNPYNFTQDSGTSEGSVTIDSGTVFDVAGNESNNASSGPFNIDLSNPTNVAFVDGPDAGSSHYFGSVPAAPTCTADDAVSGLKDCKVTGYSTAVGNHTMTATATDNAGRTATETRSYTVLAWTTKGFYAPVDMNNTVNTVKGGSTVPLKFELFAGTNELTSTSDITSLTATKSTCAPGATEDAIEVTATGATSLRYDSTGGQFIYNWKTPTGAGCYTVTMTADDGSKITAYFKSLK